MEPVSPDPELEPVSPVPLSVIMPVYNEAAGVADVIADVRKHVLDVVPGSELIIVDDCSKDDSAGVLAAEAAGDPRIRLLTNASNSGHGPTVRRGFDESVGEWIFHIDSDGQVDVSEFGLLWAARERADLLLGMRLDRHDPWHRLVLTRFTRVVVSLMARRRVPDGNVPFKLVRRSLYLHLAPLMPASAFAPSLLLVIGAVRSQARLVELETTHLPRVHGASTLNVRRLAAAVVRATRETVAFGRQTFTPFPRP